MPKHRLSTTERVRFAGAAGGEEGSRCWISVAKDAVAVRLPPWQRTGEAAGGNRGVRQCVPGCVTEFRSAQPAPSSAQPAPTDCTRLHASYTLALRTGRRANRPRRPRR
ncbi:hypothetical protein Srubr_20870 [Streptomyces rubradiris]|uniref:Uncharacterized protein n=1 Tax=Streptomyces rubradiris TaxID=285531 RepID=A0ABQ3R8Q3_STRRR|nr:hypothetical protein GCM10018792_79090 [Streptomyces rubradiris]GHI52241.1 hypothetical protein Srubr_20870 [Streptomyces rubradiris]